MSQKFFTNTIQSKFIKNLIYNTPIPIYNSVSSGDYLVKGIKYIYDNKVIFCTKNGILNYTSGYDDFWKEVKDFYPLTEYSVGEIIRVLVNNFFIVNKKDTNSVTLIEFLNSLSFLKQVEIISLKKLIYDDNELVQTIPLVEGSENEYGYTIVKNQTTGVNNGIYLYNSSALKNDNEKIEIEYRFTYTESYYTVIKQIPNSNILLEQGLLEEGYIQLTTETEINSCSYEVVQDSFFFGRKNPEIAYSFYSNDNYYDSDTHRFLGDYLRHYKNIWKTDLMPFYNCFNGVYSHDFYIDEKKDNDLIFNQNVKDGNFITNRYWFKNSNSVSLSVENNTARITIGNEIDISKLYSIGIATRYDGVYSNNLSWELGDKIYFSLDAMSTLDNCKITGSLVGSWYGTTVECKEANKWYTQSKIHTVNSVSVSEIDTNARYFIYVSNLNLLGNELLNQSIYVRNFMIINLTKMYGAGNEPKSVEEFKTNFPNKYYRYTLDSRIKTGSGKFLLRASVPSIDTSNYKLVRVPIKLNQKYTISIDCDSGVRIACAFIDKNNKFLSIENNGEQVDLTQLYNSTYSNSILSVQGLSYSNPIVYKTSNTSEIQLNENISLSTLFQMYEKYFYLLIELPQSNDSSISVLEGDYTDTNCRKYMDVEQINNIPNKEIDRICLSNLSLTQFNSKNKYPYSDNLIEYLLWNVIDNNDNIENNVAEVQRKFGIIPFEEGAYNYLGYWSKSMRPIVYNKYRNRKKSSNIDINGYVDKKIESSM